MSLIKIIHLLPEDSIGGVETAAKTTVGLKSEYFIFRLRFLSKHKKNRTNFSKKIFFIFEFFSSSIKVLNLEPDYLLVSLWKSCLSAIFIKLLKPQIKIILFLHLPKSTHFIDYFFTKLVANFAYQIWGDSLTTIEGRSKELKIDKTKKKKIISFMRYKLVPNQKADFGPNFIFWGRFHNQKKIDLSLKLFKEISKRIKNSKFILIGPDCGKLKYLKELTKELQLNKKVIFFKEMNLQEIINYSKKSSFFLQLSEKEGLGMSVVESMQLGLIPIITNVGEIKNYCAHKKNSIIFSNIENTTKEICSVLKRPEELHLLRKGAIGTWSKSSTYKEEITEAFEELI